MATIDHQAWLDALKQVQASTNAYGFDPSWFAQDQLAQTPGDRLEQMKRDYLAQNPGARDWSPEIKDAIASLRPDTFGGLVMTPEGAKAYDDLVTKKDKREQWQSVLTTAGLAALPFAAASFMAPAAGAAGGGVSSLAGIAPELTAPLSTAGSDLAASQIALGGIPGLEAAGGIGTLGAGGVGTLGGMGFEAPSLLGSVAPELTAPLSTAGSSAAASQLAMGGAPIGLFGDIPAVPSVGGPVASIPEHTFLPVGEVPTLAAAGGLGSLLGGVGSKLVDAATSPGGIASLIGAAAGAAGGGGDKTATTQSRTDPRMDPYIYGTGFGDPNSILGAAFNQFKANPTGINPTMQQGLDMQRSALLDPKYAQGYQQMRDFGASLLSGFGQSPTVQPGGGQVTDRTKALMARGQSLLG